MTTQSGVLGPHQLAVMRQTMKPFAEMEAARLAADQNAKRAERIAKGIKEEGAQ